MTVLNLVSLLVLISSTKSKRSLAGYTILACTMMTASGSPEDHQGKQRLIKKDLCGISSSYGLKITIKANNNAVNFLDVTLNLSDGKYMGKYIGNRTIPLVFSKTLQNSSTNGCLKFQLIKIHLTNQHLFIIKL